MTEPISFRHSPRRPAQRLRVLVIHQNFPGQFRHLIAAWASQGTFDLLGLGRDSAPGMPGIRWFKYRLHRPPTTEQHPYLRQMEAAVLHGQAVVKALHEIKRRGFVPDVILAHPGWGETLYAREVFPAARLIHFCEWFYGTQGDDDVGFDPEFPVSVDSRLRVSTWNALHLLNLENCDQAVTPTRWQHSRHPDTYRERIAVIHEGLATELLGPDPTASFTLPNGRVLRAGEPVATYVARNLEPYRGFHTFVRSLPHLLKHHSSCQVLIVGGDEVSYGKPPGDAQHWREKLSREVTLDPERVHFLGKLPYPDYLRLLRVSAAHVYLTYPFVLSWSMLEAMACGCLLIASDTAPVREVVRHQHNGLLVDFFDTEKLAETVAEVLEQPEGYRNLRHQASEEVREGYSLDQGIEGYREVIMEGWATGSQVVSAAGRIMRQNRWKWWRKGSDKK